MGNYASSPTLTNVTLIGNSAEKGGAVFNTESSSPTFVNAAFDASPDFPVLIDRFLEHAIEVDVDLVCDGTDVYVGGVMEHVEEASHSDSSSSFSWDYV